MHAYLSPWPDPHTASWIGSWWRSVAAERGLANMPGSKHGSSDR